MQLTPEQLTQLKAWAAAGQSLSGIQKRLEAEFNIRLTYMDLRFLLDDYAIDIANAPEPPAPTKAEPAKAPDPQSATPEAAQQEGEPQLAGGVSVDVDPINRPGSVLSGTVTFSDGISAKWYLDTMGRLGLDGVDKNYRPAPEDVQDFQMELQKILQKKGY